MGHDIYSKSYGQQLSDFDFPKMNFPRCIFPKCIFTKCIFSNCIFPNCIFLDCIFPHSNFSQLNFPKLYFPQLYLSNCIFQSTYIFSNSIFFKLHFLAMIKKYSFAGTFFDRTNPYCFFRIGKIAKMGPLRRRYWEKSVKGQFAAGARQILSIFLQMKI